MLTVLEPVGIPVVTLPEISVSVPLFTFRRARFVALISVLTRVVTINWADFSSVFMANISMLGKVSTQPLPLETTFTVDRETTRFIFVPRFLPRRALSSSAMTNM